MGGWGLPVRFPNNLKWLDTPPHLQNHSFFRIYIEGWGGRRLILINGSQPSCCSLKAFAETTVCLKGFSFSLRSLDEVKLGMVLFSVGKEYLYNDASPPLYCRSYKAWVFHSLHYSITLEIITLVTAAPDYSVMKHYAQKQDVCKLKSTKIAKDTTD